LGRGHRAPSPPVRGSEERCNLKRGSGRSPYRKCIFGRTIRTQKRILWHFALSILDSWARLSLPVPPGYTYGPYHLCSDYVRSKHEPGRGRRKARDETRHALNYIDDITDNATLGAYTFCYLLQSTTVQTPVIFSVT